MSERMTVTREVCIAETKLGHETVRCITDHAEGEPHVNDCFGVWPPCPNCGGLEEHTQRCPTPDVVGATNTWATVTWITGQKPTVKCGRRRRA